VFFALFGWLATVHAAPGTSGLNQDDEFLVRAVEVSRQEVWDARTASQCSGRAEIKKTAHSIAHDHVRAIRRLTGLARQKGMPMSGVIGGSVANVGQDKMASASDSDRIAEFLKAHEAAVALFHQEAVRGTDPDLKRFAQITLPSLQRRLLALRSLQDAYPADTYPPNSDG
jgi:predicted outer membrane protein